MSTHTEHEAACRRLALGLAVVLVSACGGGGASAPSPATGDAPVVEVAAPSPTTESTSPPAADVTDDVATGERWTGGYRATHVIGYVCEEAADCTAEVLDELELRVDGDGIEMWVSLVQANYHVCEWRGRLSADQKRGGWVHQSEDCQLMLIASDDALRLRSEGCREYCGVRAHLYADFPRASQQPLNAERLDE